MVTGNDVCQKKNPCLNGGECHPLLGDYYCDCPVNTTGRNCQKSTLLCQLICYYVHL